MNNNLSELIDACGEEFRGISRLKETGKDGAWHWRAIAYVDRVSICEDDPDRDTAVIKLQLKIIKEKKRIEAGMAELRKKHPFLNK